MKDVIIRQIFFVHFYGLRLPLVFLARPDLSLSLNLRVVHYLKGVMIQVNVEHASTYQDGCWYRTLS